MVRIKKVFIVPIMVSSFVISCDANNNLLITNSSNGNIVYITYDALDGYWTDSEGNHYNNLVLPTRKGIKWSKRLTSETPLNPKANASGYTFSEWTFSDGSEIKDDYVISENITISANYATTKFQYATWENIIKAANSGIDTLKDENHYKDDYEKNGNTFVGLERSIDYGGKSYRVRVIGEGTDEIYDETTKKGAGVAASLTFEFVDTIEGIAYSNTEDNTYETSNIRNFLNNEFVNNLPDAFHSSNYQGLRRVIKKTNIGGGNSKGNVIELPEYAFAISLSEMGIKNDTYNNAAEEENTEYAYYTKNSGTTDSANASRIKYNGNNSSKSLYWVRSPYVKDKGYCWNINGDGKLGIYNSTDKTYIPNEVNRGADIAPCFCIGETSYNRKKFTTAPWSEIIEHINNGGLAELKASYIDDDKNTEFPGTFIGLEHSLIVNNKEFRVRVIDEEHDTIKGSTKKAALTLMSTTPYTRYKKSFNEDGDKYFHALSDSYTQQQCNSYVNLFEDDVKNAVKEVTKDYIYTNYKYSWFWGTYDDISREIKTMNCKCFIPSVTEVGGQCTTTPNSSTGRRWKNDSSYYSSMSNIYALTEGEPYKYFADKNDSNRKPTNKPIVNRTNFYGLGDDGLPSNTKIKSYYTRSPHCMGNSTIPISNTHYYVNVNYEENESISETRPASGDPKFTGRGQKGSVQYDYWGLSGSVNHYIIPIFCI